MSTTQGPGVSAEFSEGEYVLSLADLLRVLRERLWVIALVTAVLVGATVGASFAQTPEYEASIKILVGQEQGSSTPGSLGGDVQGLQQLTQTMAEAVNSFPLAEAVIQQQNLRVTPEDFLEDRLSVSQIPETQFIQVDYRDTSPERARRVVESVGAVFSEQVSEVSPSANAITATVWEPARPSDEPVSPNPLRNGLLAMVLGAILGTGLAFLLDTLDDSWHSPEDLEQISGVPAFGVIPEFTMPKEVRRRNAGRGARARKFRFRPKAELRRAQEEYGDRNLGERRLVTVLDPTSAAAEAYRTLRTNLLFAVVDDPPKVMVVTSPGPGEGKSTTCANLGVVLAQAGKNVLIVDCDFRRPVLHEYFGLRSLHGVVDVLVGTHRLQEIWEEPAEGLKVAPVGPIPPNPSELLGTSRFSKFLAGVREEFDYVLLDAPPTGPVSDAAILATKGDGVLLVVDAQRTRKGSLQQALRSLEGVGASMVGTVMNNSKASNDGYYYGEYTRHGSSQ